MTLFPKKRKNNCKGCILVERMKKFLVSTFLSGMCMVFSAPVFAGNGQSTLLVTPTNIFFKLGFIEKTLLFESETGISKSNFRFLMKLFFLFEEYKTNEYKFRPKKRSEFFERFVNVLNKTRVLTDDFAVFKENVFAELCLIEKNMYSKSVKELLSDLLLLLIDLKNQEAYLSVEQKKLFLKQFLGVLSKIKIVNDEDKKNLDFLSGCVHKICDSPHIYISVELDYIKRNIPQKTTEQNLRGLYNVFTALQTIEQNLNFDQKDFVFRQFISVLNRVSVSNKDQLEVRTHLSEMIHEFCCIQKESVECKKRNLFRVRECRFEIDDDNPLAQHSKNNDPDLSVL